MAPNYCLQTAVGCCSENQELNLWYGSTVRLLTKHACQRLWKQDENLFSIKACVRNIPFKHYRRSYLCGITHQSLRIIFSTRATWEIFPMPMPWARWEAWLVAMHSSCTSNWMRARIRLSTQ